MTKTKFRNRIRIYLVTGAVWTLFWIFHNIITYPDEIVPRLFNEIWRSIYLLGINFLFYEFAVAALPDKPVMQRIVLGIVVIWIVLILMSFGLYGWRKLGLLTGVYTSFRPVKEPLPDALALQVSAGITSLVFFGACVHAYNYFELRKMTRQLRVEKQAAELAFLKAQTNPHFLFNTLNNIYSLAKDKATAAADSILRLSGIMRFMLYYSSLPSVPVKQELEVLNDYLELEKLRYDESLNLTFNYRVEDPQQPVPPLLLMPLIENAFKHGVSQTTENPFMNIDLSINKEQLVFGVTNSVPDEPDIAEVSENIGLNNLRRQLNLLYSDYELAVEQKQSMFIAKLSINLLSHV